MKKFWFTFIQVRGPFEVECRTKKFTIRQFLTQLTIMDMSLHLQTDLGMTILRNKWLFCIQRINFCTTL